MKSAETSTALHSWDLGRVDSEYEPRLQLKHTGRIDVGEGRNRVRGCADATCELAESGCRCGSISISCHSASEKVSMIEQIEAL